MAVVYFSEGEHPTGFHGYKAFTQYRHRYYAITPGMTRDRARLLALAQSQNYEYYADRQVRALGLVVDGLRCGVTREEGAFFAVDRPGLVFGRESVSLTDRRYRDAWRDACIKFCAYNVRDLDYLRWLITQEPAFDVFNVLCYRKRLPRVRLRVL